jgi:hypothetical protein
MPMQPLRPDRLPFMQGYGYDERMGGLGLPKTEIMPPDPMTPDQLAYQMQPYEMPELPDAVVMRYGKGDKNVVGDLLRIVAGEQTQRMGVSPTQAASWLTEWGYPTTMDGWTADQWAAALETNAAELTPLDLLQPFDVVERYGY